MSLGSPLTRRKFLRPPGIVLLLLCAMYFLLFVNRTNIAIAGPLMQADLKLSNTELGLAFSAFAYPYALFQLFGGMLGDRFGPRLTLAVASLAVALATAWTGAVGGLLSLFMARVALAHRQGRKIIRRHRGVICRTIAEIPQPDRHPDQVDRRQQIERCAP